MDMHEQSKQAHKNQVFFSALVGQMTFLVRTFVTALTLKIASRRV